MNVIGNTLLITIIACRERFETILYINPHTMHIQIEEYF